MSKKLITRYLVLITSYFLLVTSCSLLFTTSIFAQTTAPTVESEEPTPTIESEVEQDEIDKIRQVVKDKVMEKLDSILTKANQKIGWLGKVVSIEENTIVIEDFYKQSKILTTDQDTVVINLKKQNGKLIDIKPDQIIVAMGYLDPDSNLNTKRILITNTALEDNLDTIIFGTVSDISQTTSTISLVTKDRKVYQIKSDKNSKDLSKNDKVIAVIKPEKKDSQTWLILSKKVLSTPTPTPAEE